MSEFENYTKTSKDYDNCRHAVGVDVMLGAIAHVMQGKPLSEASVVDIGCGTGNYALALSPYVGHITGIEHNSGMLEQATKKTGHLPNVTLHQGDATNIPLPDNCCDVVICTQVLQHISGGFPHFTGPSQAIKEAYRILKEKGAFVINTCSPDQILKTSVLRHLIPRATESASARWPPVPLLCDKAEETGFKLQSVLTHCYELSSKKDVYLDLQGPLSEKWRNGMSSIWAMATPDELEESLTNWKKEIQNGTAQKFIDDAESVRKIMGETTTIVTYKGF